MKKIQLSSFVCFLLIAVASLTGCGIEIPVQEEVVANEMETVDEGSNTGFVMDSIYEDGTTSVTQTVDVLGEDFDLVCTYDTGNYPLKDWRVTDNKMLRMTVNTLNLPEGYKVHIEHVHADIVLKATTPQIDGITQDSMDDYDHRTPSIGFPISDNVQYNNVFAIEGYTEQFYTLWGHFWGAHGYGHGHISSNYDRLTEGNIREVGTYAEKLIVVYDIVITSLDREEGYVKSVYSEVLIPLVSEVEYITKDFFTGEEL